MLCLPRYSLDGATRHVHVWRNDIYWCVFKTLIELKVVNKDRCDVYWAFTLIRNLLHLPPSLFLFWYAFARIL